MHPRKNSRVDLETFPIESYSLDSWSDVVLLALLAQLHPHCLWSHASLHKKIKWTLHFLAVR